MPCHQISWSQGPCFNSLWPEQNCCYIEDNIFRCIFLKEEFCILIKISMNFNPNNPIDNRSVLVQKRQFSYYLNQLWSCLLPNKCVTQLRWVDMSSSFMRSQLKVTMFQLIKIWRCIYTPVNWIIIGSCWINADLLSIGPLGTQLWPQCVKPMVWHQFD